jgi:hypothetical protein
MGAAVGGGPAGVGGAIADGSGAGLVNGDRTKIRGRRAKAKTYEKDKPVDCGRNTAAQRHRLGGQRHSNLPATRKQRRKRSRLSWY